jgi:hypothetical protein
MWRNQGLCSSPNSRRSFSATVALIVFILISAIANGQEQSENDSMHKILARQKVTFEALLGFQTADSITSYFVALPTPDLDARIVYYSLLDSLERGVKSDLGLISATPRDELEFQYFYRLCQSPFGDSTIDVRLNDIACSYYGRLARAVSRKPIGLAQFYATGLVADGEMFDLYASSAAWLFNKDCVTFLRGLTEAHPKIQEVVLSALDLGLADKKVLLKNKERVPKAYFDSLVVRLR